MACAAIAENAARFLWQLSFRRYPVSFADDDAFLP
jgi:hypothetical protein